MTSHACVAALAALQEMILQLQKDPASFFSFEMTVDPASSEPRLKGLSVAVLLPPEEQADSDPRGATCRVSRRS